MSEMTYKQAIKILSETKVADMPYNGCGSNHKMYDIARRMAIEALKEKAAAETYESSIQNANMSEPIAKIGDTIYVLTIDAPNEIEVTKVKSVKRVIVDGKETFRYRAPCMFDDWGGATWTFYDQDFGVKFFVNALAATEARKQALASDVSRIPCQIGDIIPFQVKTGYVINYIVEKIKIGEDGTVKIRCKHGGGGQPRSFLSGEIRRLLLNNGKL
jgi:hypothetical protein